MKTLIVLFAITCGLSFAQTNTQKTYELSGELTIGSNGTAVYLFYPDFDSVHGSCVGVDLSSPMNISWLDEGPKKIIIHGKPGDTVSFRCEHDLALPAPTDNNHLRGTATLSGDDFAQSINCRKNPLDCSDIAPYSIPSPLLEVDPSIRLQRGSEFLDIKPTKEGAEIVDQSGKVHAIVSNGELLVRDGETAASILKELITLAVAK